MTGLILAGEGYTPPGVDDVFPQPLFSGIPWFAKAMLLVMISVVILVGLFVALGRKPKVVPSRMQFAGELVYGFVRDGIGRDVIGSKDYMRFFPLLFTLFSFILLNNIFGVTPLVSLPPMAHISYPLVLALIVLVTYNYVGIRRQGFVAYFKDVMFIPGVPTFVYPILAPVELLTILIIRPFTLTLRLFANMFSGHLLLLVFITGSEYLMFKVANPLLKSAGLLTGGMALIMTFFELFVEIFQAYIFTLLTALYIGGAVSEGH